MKDSASAASAGAELVLRRFPWAVLVRRPLLPPPETLPDRWLQAAEEEEVELLPFRSPPREENGTGPTQAPAGKWSWGLRAGKGEDLAGKCARRATLAGAKDPPNCLEISGFTLAGQECSSFGGEGQEAGSKSGATVCRGNPQWRPGSSEGPERRQRRELGSTWLRGAAAARQTRRSVSKLRISQECDPPGASCWQIREPNALLKFCMGREGCEGTKKG